LSSSIGTKEEMEEAEKITVEEESESEQSM